MKDHSTGHRGVWWYCCINLVHQLIARPSGGGGYRDAPRGVHLSWFQMKLDMEIEVPQMECCKILWFKWSFRTFKNLNYFELDFTWLWPWIFTFKAWNTRELLAWNLLLDGRPWQCLWCTLDVCQIQGRPEPPPRSRTSEHRKGTLWQE